MKYFIIILSILILTISVFLITKNFIWQKHKSIESTGKNVFIKQNLNTKPLILNKQEINNININSSINTPKIIFDNDFSEIKRGDTTKKQVIFTFDAGSSNNSIREILESLNKYGLKATFFLTGKWAERYPDDVKNISRAGHEIFNHTYSHPRLTQISDQQIIEELRKTEQIIFDLTGKTTKPFFRPPYGERSSHVLALAKDEGYQSVFWTVDVLDWQESSGMTEEKAKERIYNNLANGNIFLMHVGDNITGKILDEVINKIQTEGYKILPLSLGI